VKRSGVHAYRRFAAVSAAGTALTLGLAGCSATSPATTTIPYEAADGASATIPGAGIKLRNFLVVSSAKGAPGQVVGAVINPTNRTVVVTMQTELGPTAQPTQTRIRVAARSLATVGPTGTEVAIADTPVAPGALMSISAAYAADGGITLDVPVLPPTGFYASYTPAPTTAAPTDAPTPAATGSADPGASPSPRASKAAKAAKATPSPTAS
jgi:hypothetical protein